MAVLDGKAAIVTGSARGIGRATAELLAEQGAQVLINDLDGDVAEEAAGEIEGQTAVFAGDLTKEGVPDQLVAVVRARGEVKIADVQFGMERAGTPRVVPGEKDLLDLDAAGDILAAQGLQPHGVLTRLRAAGSVASGRRR